MTMPAYNSFQLYKGDTLRFSLTLQSGSISWPIPDGTVFSAAVKEKNQSDITASFSTDILSASSGLVLFTLPATESSLLESNKNWVYDVQMKNSESIVSTLMTGNIFVTDEVTQ